MSITDLWKYWKHFWFRPEAPLSISVFRILFGLIVLENSLLMYPDLFNFYGPHGICTLHCSQQILSVLGPAGLNILNWLPANNTSITIMFWFVTIAAICLTLGLFTKTSALCVYLGIAAFQQQNCLIQNGGDILLKMTAFYLIFSPAGYCMSLDSFLKRKWRPKQLLSQIDPSGWPQRLYRFLIALIYFQAFWSKLEDKTWLDGSAIYYVLREQEFMRFPVAWIANNLWICQTLTWGTLLVEFSMWSLIWFKETRYFVLAAALFLHLGIEYTMNLPVFESMMIASLVVFIPSKDIKSVYNKLHIFFSRLIAGPAPHIMSFSRDSNSGDNAA